MVNEKVTQPRSPSPGFAVKYYQVAKETSSFAEAKFPACHSRFLTSP